MFKKSISILLIFSVNLLLLAHAVLPHHHHNGIPHLVFAGTGEHHHSDDFCCCEHEDQDKDSCALDLEVDVYCNTEEHHHHLCCTDHSDHFNHLPTAILLTYSYDISASLQGEPLRIPPYLISCSQDPVVSSTGLRAPPLG
jgi:hypothetical protein